MNQHKLEKCKKILRIVVICAIIFCLYMNTFDLGRSTLLKDEADRIFHVRGRDFWRHPYTVFYIQMDIVFLISGGLLLYVLRPKK